MQLASLLAILLISQAVAVTFPLLSLQGSKGENLYLPDNNITVKEFALTSGDWQEVTRLRGWPQFFPSGGDPFWVAQVSRKGILIDASKNILIVPVDVHRIGNDNQTTWFVFFDSLGAVYANPIASLSVKGVYLEALVAGEPSVAYAFFGNERILPSQHFIMKINVGSTPSIGPLIPINCGEKFPVVLGDATYHLKSGKVIFPGTTALAKSLYHIDPTSGQCSPHVNVTAVFPKESISLLSITSSGTETAILTGPVTMEELHFLDIDSGRVKDSRPLCSEKGSQFPSPVWASDRVSGTGYWIGYCNPPRNSLTLVVFTTENKFTSYTLQNQTNKGMRLVDIY